MGDDPKPALWALFNPDTGRFRTTCYQTAEVALARSKALTDNYTRLVAAPLFIHGGEESFGGHGDLIAASRRRTPLNASLKSRDRP